MIMRSASALRIGLQVASLTVAGCDPVVNIAAANFPAWLLCAIAGAILTTMLRQALALIKVEPYLGPLLLIYPCLVVVQACLIYLIFFNRN